MNYTYVKDENGKISNILVNGKPVKRGSMRGFRKAQETSYFQLMNQNYPFYNPFSYVVVDLNPLEWTIYAFCLEWYKRYSKTCDTKHTEVPIQTYDDMKYFLLEINPQAYMDLLD
jgi:hypothetical protein